MTIQHGTADGLRDDSAWCALYTRHQHEKTVSDMLSAKGFEVFLPCYESLRRWKDRGLKVGVYSSRCFPCRCFPAMCLFGERLRGDCRS